MTNLNTSAASQIKLALKAMQNALSALEAICDIVYSADRPQPYSILSETDAEDIHLEAAGMLLPLDTAFIALHAYANPSTDRLDLTTKTVAE